MTDTFRALCAELANHLQGRKELECGWGEEDPEQDLLDRARAALAQPEPVGPTDEELIQLAIDTRLYRFQATAGDPIQYEMTEQQIHAFARTVLARWGRPAIKPVPVSERLPGPEDCDGCGNCWWFRQATRDDFPFWWLGGVDNTSTHWLPHHALPVPTPSRGTH